MAICLRDRCRWRHPAERCLLAGKRHFDAWRKPRRSRLVAGLLLAAVAVRTDGRSGVNELLQGKEGTTINDLSVRFIVDEPAEGQYSFIVRGPYGPDREMVEGEVTFDVPTP